MNYPPSAITKLQNNTSIVPVVLKAKIHFYHVLQISEIERDKLASKLLAKDSDELYYAACHVERTDGKEKARNHYAAAFNAGSLLAGERLVEYFVSNNTTYLFDMERLADALIPRAAFEYGKACLDNKQYVKGTTYLRISAALNYTPAVLFLSDRAYKKALRTEKANDIQTAIRLYLFISDNPLVISNTSAKLGVLYHLMGDFPRAKQYFDRDHSLAEADYRFGLMYYYGDGVSKNLELAKRHLSAAKQLGSHAASSLLEQIQREQKQQEDNDRSHTRSNHKSNYNENANYKSKKTYVSSSDDSCFITTATCKSKGKPDDCEELTAFRKYRDETLSVTDEGKALIAEYYRIAPGIVECISREDNAKEIYSFLYSEYILPGYKLLQDGRGEEATQLYTQGVIMLANRYGIVLSDTRPTSAL